VGRKGVIIGRLKIIKHMKNMMLSPMQNEYVTKEEFGEFKENLFERLDKDKQFVREGFDMMEVFIKNVETPMYEIEARLNKRFDAVDGKFDAVDVKIGSLEGKIDNMSDQLRLIIKYVVKQ
jgi:hypothetical protein